MDRLRDAGTLGRGSATAAWLDLLGFRIVRRPWRGSKRVTITFPSQRALREVKHHIKTLTTRTTTNLSLDQLIHVLNPILRCWTNYHRHARQRAHGGADGARGGTRRMSLCVAQRGQARVASHGVCLLQSSART